MKRRWFIRPARDFIPTRGMVCGSARYVWCRTGITSERRPWYLVGCVCHHSWTQRVRSFVEIPDA